MKVSGQISVQKVKWTMSIGHSLMLKDNFNIQRDMSSSEASLPGQQWWAAREVARLARDRAQGSPGRESTENFCSFPECE